jgi:hypothetical protein
MSSDEIAEYLAIKGVTRCPTVCLNKTTAKTSRDDRRVLKAHQEKQNEFAEERRKRLYLGRFTFFWFGFGFIPLFEFLPSLT